MTRLASHRRAQFSELEIDQKFFDPISAEYFIKTSDSTASMLREGVGDRSKADEFEPDDVVAVED